jgi:hypothetical protein
MISLATTTTNTRIAPEPAEAKPAHADAGRAKDSFSAVLAQQGPQKAASKDEVGSKAKPAPRDGETTAAPDAAKTPASLLNGIAMPQTAKTGKSLPVTLPGTAGEAEGESDTETPEEAATQAAVDLALATAIVPQAPLSADASALPETENAAQGTGAARARLAAAHLPLPTPQGATSAAGEPQAAGDKASGASVAIQMASQPTAQAADLTADARGDSDASAARPRDAAIERTLLQPATADAVRQEDFASLAAPTLSTPAPTIPAGGDAKASMQVDALRDLTRIVDSLAAAREVFAPATEALSIDHAEFGELSLRFDQRRDGALSVQLSASTPDAHRAVAQAVGAQSFHSAADGQPQGQHASQSQSQTAARGGMADRDGASGHARHEQPAAQQQQQQRQASPQPGRTGQQPAGIFA